MAKCQKCGQESVKESRERKDIKVEKTTYSCSYYVKVCSNCGQLDGHRQTLHLLRKITESLNNTDQPRQALNFGLKAADITTNQIPNLSKFQRILLRIQLKTDRRIIPPVSKIWLMLYSKISIYTEADSEAWRFLYHPPKIDKQPPPPKRPS